MAAQPGSLDHQIDVAHEFVRRVIDIRMNRAEWVMRQYGLEMTAWMQANARWTDDTGRARRGLLAHVTNGARRSGQNRWVIDFAYGYAPGVDYAEALETEQAGKYSILRPTTAQFIPRIRRDLKYVLGGERG